jgi:hypothetical protein
MTPRYLVFACEAYYPSGGWGDFQKAFTSYQEARDYADSIRHKWSGSVELVDLNYVYPDRRGQL